MNYLNLFHFHQSTIHKTNFEHVQYAIKNSSDYYIVNTLPLYDQKVLIKNTIHAGEEEAIINDMISNMNVPDKNIILYGKNCNDESIEFKYNQFINMGLKNVFVYTGGLFEWMLLQDIYGTTEFPTTEPSLDLLKYKPASPFHYRYGL
jgi:hypothetical protein